jgi:HD-like signal output (HDOD) protein
MPVGVKADKWQFPAHLADAIRYHPRFPGRTKQEFAALVNIANSFTHLL